MKRILAVDDSRAIRSIVNKQLEELGMSADEAENGEEGLARLDECEYDLVLLDVTMPVLDGPGMLEKMRAAGNKTPVIMLTSESKRSIVAGVMKLGIEDYILKPWKPDELRAKLQKVLGAAAAGGAAAPAATHAEDAGGGSAAAAPVAVAPSAAAGAAVTAGKQFIDLLVVDDMENVAKKLRSLVPQHLSVHGCVSAQSAMSACREKVFRVVLIDTEIPDVNSAVLMSQLRAIQPHAAFIALALRTTNDAEKEANDNGFDGVLYKPFNKDSIDDFLIRYFDSQELVSVDDNLVKILAFTGKENRLDKYYVRVASLLSEALEKSAAACFDETIIDVRELPLKPDRTPRLFLEVEQQANRVGVTVRFVGNPEVAKLLKSFSETARVPVFDSVEKARAA